MIPLGTAYDGRRLLYDASLYEFRLERELVSWEDVAALDRAAHIAWLAPEQRDWFWRIDRAALDACNREALQMHGNGYMDMTPEERVQADAKRDDSILAGKIVDADPALVQAVANALEEQGLLGRSAGGQPAVALPEGMEALGQLQGQSGRKMTVLEHFLMRQILKNDDKAKLKREKKADSKQTAQDEASKKDAAELEDAKDISKGQKRMAKRESREERRLRRRSKTADGIYK